MIATVGLCGLGLEAITMFGESILNKKENKLSEQDIEQEIQEKGLTAPRLTPESINRVITSETFTTMPSGKAMVCEITLINGFTVRGESAVVSKENFNQEIGEEISRKNARDKIWGHEGYLLQQRLFDGDVLVNENETTG